MNASLLRSVTASVLSSLMVLSFPLAAFADVKPPPGGTGGVTVTGQVVDDDEDDGSRSGEIVDDDDRGTALWVLLGAGAALALLLDASLKDSGTPTGDCDELFPPGSIGAAAARDGSECNERGAAAAIFTAMAQGAAGTSLADMEGQLTKDLLPFAVPDTLDVAGANQLRNNALARVGQPGGVKVNAELPEYLIANQDVPATFTVTAGPGTDLSKPLYLVAGDLALAGVFPHELGVPFAVPVDMDVLRSTGSWSYSTPYRAISGTYFLDSFVSTELPGQLLSDARGASVIDTVQSELSSLESKLRRASGNKADRLALERDAMQDHLVWLMEWDRLLQQ